MKNITKKIVLAIASLSFLASASFAGELTVTGGVKATYSIQSSGTTTGKNDAGKGLGLTNEFTLGANGELDNGWTWKYALDIDGATVQDDASLVFGLGDIGTVALMITEGSLSQKYGFDASAYGVGSDTGYGGGTSTTTTMQYGKNISSYNNLQYHLPAGLLPFGIGAKVAVSPNAGGNNSDTASGNAAGTDNASGGDRATEYQITAAPIAGLSIGASYFNLDDEPGAKQGYESGSAVAKYSVGPITIGYGRTLVAENIGTVVNSSQVTGYDNKAYSVGFKVNDSLSLSYTTEESKREEKSKHLITDAITRADKTMEIDTIQAAYTVGGMTLSVSSKEVDGDSYTTGASVNETLFALAIAF
jgi:hypothetical protein